jgi:hypothetical protein
MHGLRRTGLRSDLWSVGLGAALMLTLTACEEWFPSGEEDAGPLVDSGGPPVTPMLDAGTPPGTLGVCEPGSSAPCGTVITPAGVEIKLGPYGVVVDRNAGQGFENAVAIGDSLPGVCDVFAATFAEEAEETARLLDVTGLDFALYTVYRPANWPAGQKVPIVTWGNGTCAQPEGYGSLLRYVASHGFFVVAANSRWVGGAAEMLQGVDFAFAANGNASSPYYQKLDTSKVAAMGHSQGGLGTANSAADARVKSVILFNGGTSASKPFLAISGDLDISGQDAASFASAVTSASKAAWLFYHMVPATGTFSGHLTLMKEPQRVIEPTVHWLKYMLNGDSASRAWFVGPGCNLCNSPAQYEYGQVGLN